MKFKQKRTWRSIVRLLLNKKVVSYLQYFCDQTSCVTVPLYQSVTGAGSYSWQKELNNPSLDDSEIDRILERRTQQLNEAYEQSLSSNGKNTFYTQS